MEVGSSQTWGPLGRGNNDGSKAGEHYFDCKGDKYGCFVRPDNEPWRKVVCVFRSIFPSSVLSPFVAMPFAPSSKNAPSGMARSPVRSVLVTTSKALVTRSDALVTTSDAPVTSSF